jgi:dephospho-CoA kinase
MKVFGLTGGIGSGKSTAARLLSERGIAVVDTDLLARQIVEPGQPAVCEIQTAFGNNVTSPDGRLRRDELARIIFADDSARQRLEAILHPRIRKLWQGQIETWRREGRPVAVVVIPLLFETNAASHFDKTICVACSAATQHERLLARGWTPEQIAQRLAAQLPISRKMELSDHVVWAEGEVEVLATQLQRIIS